MNKKVFVVVMGVALAVVLTAGGLVASNMGFKLNYPLVPTGAGSNSGLNTIALPFNPQSGVATASALLGDIGLADVANVQRFLEASDGYQIYTGRKGTPDPDFSLAAGEGYFLKMSNPVDYIVVGSHDPSLAVSLDAAGVGSNSGLNFFAYPYHSTSSTASELMADIVLANVANVQKFLEASDGYQIYTGRKGTPDPDFALTPGESYFIKMNTTVSYVPSHY